MPDALLAALGGALGIGIPSMGVHALLKDSPVPFDGGSGGRPNKRTAEQNREWNDRQGGGGHSAVGPAAFVLIVLALGGAPACTSGFSWPKMVQSCAPSPAGLVEDITDALFRDGTGSLSERAVEILTDLGRRHGAAAVLCAVNALIGELEPALASDAVAASEPLSATVRAARARAEEFLKTTGAKVEP